MTKSFDRYDMIKLLMSIGHGRLKEEFVVNLQLGLHHGELFAGNRAEG